MSTLSAVHLVPGAGLVQRTDSTLVVVYPSDEADAFASVVLEECRNAHGSALVRRLAQRVVAVDPTESVPFGVVTPTDRGCVAFLHGAVELRAGDDVVTSAHVMTWVEHTVVGVDSLLVTAAAGASQADERTDLAAGVVVAAGFELDLEPPAAEDGPATADPRHEMDAPSAHASIGDGSTGDEPGDGESPDDEASTEALPALGDDVELLAIDEALPPRPIPLSPFVDRPGRGAMATVAAPRSDAPPADDEEAATDVVLVEGVRCPRDHHNEPHAAYCAQCGLKLGVHRTLRPVMGPRPQLGVLVVDDGTTIPVRHSLVVGREPAGHELVRAGRARAAELCDPTDTVSRVHAHIELEGWDVHVADLGSANGTFVRLRPDEGWIEVAGSDRVRLSGGATLRLGDREVVYESHEITAEVAS